MHLRQYRLLSLTVYHPLLSLSPFTASLQAVPDRSPHIEPRSPDNADDEQYTIEVILNHRKVGRSRQFLVHWEGYSDTEDSWVKEGDIDAEMVQVYFEGLEKEKGENKTHKVGTQTITPPSKGTGGRSARTQT